ncbi:MAG: phage virion morphogenesis protein [Desulfuromonadales bacterium]|nr:phage virion morphogenesis protein [Desulfuromonadales bacterium]
MAGAGLDFNTSIDDRDLREMLRRLARAARDMSPAMKNIGEHLVQATEERFRTETGPDGQKWADVSEKRKARKKHPKILTESLRLRQSIHPEASKDKVVVGTDVPYAAAHQFGFSGQVQVPQHNRRITKVFGKKLKFPVWGTVNPFSFQQEIPARPFLGIDEDDQEEIRGIIEDHIAFALKKAPESD